MIRTKTARKLTYRFEVISETKVVDYVQWLQMVDELFALVFLSQKGMSLVQRF